MIKHPLLRVLHHRRRHGDAEYPSPPLHETAIVFRAHQVLDPAPENFGYERPGKTPKTYKPRIT